MEKLIPSFNRVLLGLDEPSDLIARYPQLESAILSGDVTAVSPSDRLLLLDLPSPASVATSLAEIQSSPDKATLLHRALHAPETLSSDEIDLLRHRFWPSHEYDRWLPAWLDANAKLQSDTSEEHVISTSNRLLEVREKLAGEEEKAFEAAWREWHWRRCLHMCWGYAIYCDPDSGADGEDFQCRRDGALQWAGCSPVAKAKQEQGRDWTLYSMEWPAGGPDEHFEGLRRDFKTVRDTLPEGILRNVFLVVDQDSVHSVLYGKMGGSVCDDMWVWAVDPDYQYRDDKQEIQNPVQDQETATYPGYLRVRLQQLVNNFYAARHSDDGENIVPLETLWACAQKSYERAFVSVREEDFQKWVPTRDVGSCLRP
ncbi:hypothetical protein LZ32DRAFT_618939 [Colletotrichum eremochloae]|nr:hypothetical protein LZ32DRAFT_618939 [Colletotrichum eremochloae]